MILREFEETMDPRRKKKLALEIKNNTSDQNIIKEMDEYIKFHDIFNLG